MIGSLYIGGVDGWLNIGGIVVPEGEPDAGQTETGHKGGINDFNTLVQRFVQDHNLIIIFNNTPGAHLIDIAIGIRAILHGQEADVPTRTLNYHLE